MLTVYRTMTSTPKLRLGTITDPFSGNLKTTGEIKPIMQYVIKNFFSAKAEKIFRGHEDKSPFIVGRNLLVLTTAGPNVSNQLTGYPLDSKIYENNPVLLKAYLILSKYLKCQDLYSKLKADMAVFQKKGITIPSSLSGPVKSGKLSLKFEAAGKVRVFAIIDAWAQSLLSHVHTGLFDILKSIPQDGTFDQLKPIRMLLDKNIQELYSFDLTAATDRLPIDIQKDILSILFNSEEAASAWKDLLIERDYSLETSLFPNHNGNYRYAVGQPMGALSSWASLALTHHVIIQIASRRAGLNVWFEDYAVLGDDVVIGHKTVASCYQNLMEDLGVSINLSKSLTSKTQSLEFAKKLFIQGVNVSPLGPKSIFELIKNPHAFKEMVIDYNLLGVVDAAMYRDHLIKLISDASGVSSQKWVQRIRSSYWDLIGWFGLNLLQDLSPSINAQAISSLEQQERSNFESVLSDLLISKVSHGWFKSIEKDEETYRKYRRFYSFSDVSLFPSSESMISAFSEKLASSASHYLHNFEELTLAEQVKLAYSDLARITWAFDEQRSRSRKVKSLELSRDLLLKLAQHNPSLVIKLITESQADTTIDNVVGLIRKG